MGYDTALAAIVGAEDVRSDRDPDRDALPSRAAGGTDPDVDVVEELGDEIATLAAHLHAGTARLLALLARFDRLRGWVPGGHRSCAHWLAYRSGLDLGTAREHVRVARALAQLPRTAEAMGRGALSFSQVRALTRVAEPESEGDLIELAEGVTAAQLERLVRAWKKGSREDEAARERERHRSRVLSVFPDDDGMYVIQGRLDPEAGAALMRAVEAASDALYRDRRDVSLDADGRALDSDREASRRRADAIALVAERALAAGFGSGGKADASRAPVSGTRAERYQVVLHVDPATLSADGDPGRSELEDGTRVSAETSRRLACDASVVRLVRARAGPEGTRGALSDPVSSPRRGAPDARGRGGTSLDVGRRTRTIPPALRRALEARDRGCRFPGCELRFTEAHHVVHWADGGATSLDNTVLLCRFHHRLVHEDGWRVVWWRAGQPAFRDPRGS
ncbi:MAG: DUF222 domain-containing protein, partial [Gemmatimonadota bacterium]|nr:DUF222 domain-containing protein [Gemmatimonadota bacterium]